MAKTISIGQLTFPTKKAALEMIRSIRDRYSDGVRLSYEDHIFIRDLVNLHPEAEDKIGLGISHFTVATENKFGGRNRHFVLHRHDGTYTDFSFSHCLTPNSNKKNDILLALRQAIKDQIWEFRQRAFSSGVPVICPYEKIILSRDRCHVDHEAPTTFEALVNCWLTSQGIRLEAVQITPPVDNQLVGQMTNTPQIASWQSFHRTHAKLRLLSVKGNLSGARQKHPE